MQIHPAATAKRSRRLTLAAGSSFVSLLDLPATDNLSRDRLQIQRGHILLTVDAPGPGVAARRSIAWRLTTSGQDAAVVALGKLGSSNVNGASGLVEPPRTGGVVLPVFGGVRLEVSDFLMPGGTAAEVSAVYVAGTESLRAPEWPSTYRAVLASNAVPALPGPFIEIGPPPFGATRYQVTAPNVADDAGAPGPIECEWLHANGTVAARDFYSLRTSVLLAPQGYHARIRTVGAYGASGFAPNVLWSWS